MITRDSRVNITIGLFHESDISDFWKESEDRDIRP